MVRALASHQCRPGSDSAVDAICGLSLLSVISLAPRGLSLGTLVLIQHFQILIRSGTHGHVSPSSYELLTARWVNKSQYRKITIPHTTSENE